MHHLLLLRTHAVLAADLELLLLSLIKLLNILVDFLVVVLDVALHELLRDDVEWMVLIHQLLPYDHEQLQRIVVHRVDRLNVLDVLVDLLDLVLALDHELILEIDEGELLLDGGLGVLSIPFKGHELLLHGLVELTLSHRVVLIPSRTSY